MQGFDSDHREAYGVVVDDPLLGFEVGSSLRFQSTPFRFNVEVPEATVKNWDLFEGTLLMVSFMGQEKQRILGSAVMVAPGVALCATHVLQPQLDVLVAGRLVATCHSLAPHGLQLWRVQKVTLVPNSDLTILGISLISRLPPNNHFYLPIITTRFPKFGEKLAIWGFRAGEPNFHYHEDGQGVAASGDLWVGSGPITQIYPTGRDRAMLPWPVAEVNCPARGGMSGGPAYDQHGALIGLLSSSIDADSGKGISYVSMLWPALTARFESCWPEGLIREPVSLLEMDRRLCSIDKPDAIVARYDELAGITHTEYRLWE